MAKKKDKQGKDAAAKAGRAKAAGAKAGKIPKHIAGIKLPKDLRKSGEKLIEVANSPIGRQMLAAGMTALATAAAARTKAGQAAGREAADAAGAAAETASATAQQGMTQASEIVDALANAAGAALQRMFEKKGQG